MLNGGLKICQFQHSYVIKSLFVQGYFLSASLCVFVCVTFRLSVHFVLLLEDNSGTKYCYTFLC